MTDRYGRDVLASGRHRPAALPTVTATVGEVVAEDPATGWVGLVVGLEAGAAVLEDRAGRRRLLPLPHSGLWVQGRAVTLVRPAPGGGRADAAPRRTPSGSVAAPAGAPARVARASRIYCEGRHDAELVEKVWGADLRDLGVVVEPLDGLDHLPAAVAAFAPGPSRRLGVLVDHLVRGTKESRLAAAVDSPHVLVTGHPFVDVWAAVRPGVVGLTAWPAVPRGQDWKSAVAGRLGCAEVGEAWRLVLSRVHHIGDLDPGLSGAVEQLIDFVAPPE